ncbi:MAG: hypothetical protein WDW36_005088 [Sanguina aurantia]
MSRLCCSDQSALTVMCGTAAGTAALHLSAQRCAGHQLKPSSHTLIRIDAGLCSRPQVLVIADNHHLEALDLSGCGSLRTLVCNNNNRLALLRIQDCSRLQYLDRRWCNALGEVDVSTCPASLAFGGVGVPGFAGDTGVLVKSEGAGVHG